MYVVVLFGRMHNIATPANAALQRIANTLAAMGTPLDSMSLAEFEKEIG